MKAIVQTLMLSSDPTPLNSKHWRQLIKDLVEFDPATSLFKLKGEPSPGNHAERVRAKKEMEARQRMICRKQE